MISKVVRMNLQITGRCNYNCVHCFNAKDNEPLQSELTLDEITHLLDECVISGIRKFTITGGEPLIHPKYREIIEEIYNRGMSVFELNTNGHFIDQDMLDWMKSIKYMPLIKISFDGLGFHNWMRGNQFAEEKTLKAIKLCIDNGFMVKVQMNVNKRNESSILNSLKLLDEMGVLETRLIKTTKSPRWEMNCKDDSMSIHEYYDFSLDLIGKYVSEKHQMTLTVWLLYSIDPVKKTYSLTPIKCNPDQFHEPMPLCLGAKIMIAVGSDGQVYPCMQAQGYFIEHNIDLGNVKKEGLGNILKNGPYFDMMAKTEIDHLKAGSQCNVCEHFKYCYGGCPAMSILTSGDFLLEDKSKCIFFKEGYYQKFKEVMPRDYVDK